MVQPVGIFIMPLVESQAPSPQATNIVVNEFGTVTVYGSVTPPPVSTLFVQIYEGSKVVLE
jgi:hypothetical protein